ncbi:MAG: hypothetical protein M3R27_09545 [Bacteroidota bacterium]|nr:hypothetical protein [Bacteroidota bacterium]
MTNKKKILLIGIDPSLIDFTAPEFSAFPGMTSEIVSAGVKGAVQQLIEMGYDAELCWTDFGDTAISVINSMLTKNSFDGVLIGAGIRIPPPQLLLFEKMINEIHEHAPGAKIIFNTNPKDSIEAVKRWL